MMLRRGTDNQITDEALLAGVAVGDEDAVLVFVRRFQRRLFGLAFAIVADVGMAEDVAQEAFIRILRHAAVFDPRRGSVATWALTITRNLAIDALRARRAVSTAPDDLVFMNLVSLAPSPDDVLTIADAAAPAWKALSELPLDQRRCVVLAAVYGRTATEIAAIESIPVGTAKSRLRLGMAKLRDVVIKDAP